MVAASSANTVPVAIEEAVEKMKSVPLDSIRSMTAPRPGHHFGDD